MLGYGSFLASSNTAKAAITTSYLGLQSLADSRNPLVYSKSQVVNLLPLLAYQKVYYDFFSESQWEKHLAYAYNVDYWDGRSQLLLAPEMLQLRYANYPKDYFMGILPSSQYGSVALFPSIVSSANPGSVLATSGVGSGTGASSAVVVASSSTVTVGKSESFPRYLSVNADLSALSIRATEYLQRWKEVVQFSSKDNAAGGICSPLPLL